MTSDQYYPPPRDEYYEPRRSYNPANYQPRDDYYGGSASSGGYGRDQYMVGACFNFDCLMREKFVRRQPLLPVAPSSPCGYSFEYLAKPLKRKVQHSKTAIEKRNYHFFPALVDDGTLQSHA